MKNKLNYTDVGIGNIALVFLHYFGGSSNSWAKVIDTLSNKFRCIAIDLPGFGNSQGEVEKLSVSECSKEVAQVIRVLALKQYILVGHSMGGKIALSLAAMQPFGCALLVLVAPSPPVPEPMTAAERTQLLTAFGNRHALETSINSITGRHLLNCEIENTITDNLRTSFASWKWWIEEGSREDISAQMLTVRVPVFVISGEKDPKFSSSYLESELAKYFPLAFFHVIPEAGHLLPIEAPAAVAKLISQAVMLQAF